MMKKKLMTISAVWLCLWWTNSQVVLGQVRLIFTLEQTQQRALAYSNQLRLDSLQQKKLLLKREEAIQKRLPELSANLSYLRISDNITPFRLTFPTTGEITLNPQILDQSFNSIQLSQLIWGGGRVRTGLKMADLDLEKNLLNLQISSRNLISHVTTLWYQLFSFKQNEKIISTNLNTLKAQKLDVEKNVRQGIVLSNEVYKIDLAISSLETNLVELSSLKNTISFQLQLLLGIPNDEDIEIPDELPSIQLDVFSLSDALGTGLKNRSELKQIALIQQQTLLSEKIQKSFYLPTISAVGTFQYDRPNQRVFPNEARYTGTWFAGFFLQWNLSQLYTNRVQVKGVDLQQSSVVVQRQNMEDKIQMEISELYYQTIQSNAKIKLAEKALALAKENFRVEENRFKANMTGATAFLEANNMLLQAQLNLAAAKAAADLAHQKLIISIQ